jgi:hypothetical protein
MFCRFFVTLVSFFDDRIEAESVAMALGLQKDAALASAYVFSTGSQLMQITRFEDAPRYDAPKHFDVRSFRLQGADLSATRCAWVGITHYLPEGRAEMDVGPLEKIYVVLEGELTIELGDGSVHVLRRMDSCHIPGGEARAVRNASHSVATLLVIMPHAEPRP